MFLLKPPSKFMLLSYSLFGECWKNWDVSEALSPHGGESELPSRGVK